MSISVGSMSAGLGLDMSEFQRGMQKATEVARSSSENVSAEMKRTSREGAESLRLIDEAIGVHLSRPLTRILTQEFPAFAEGLQAVFGGAVFGAVAAAGVEAFHKVSESIERAGHSQEAWGEASRKADEVFEDAIGSIQKKLAEVNGVSASIKFNMEGAEMARHAIDAVAEALQREQKAAEEAGSLTTRIWTGVGDVFSSLAQGAALALPDALGGSFATKLIESNEQAKALALTFLAMKEGLDDALKTDAANGTHSALGLINEDLDRIKFNLGAMEKAGNSAGVTLAENARKMFEDSKQIEEASERLASAQIAKDYSEQIAKAAGAFDDLQKDIGSGLGRVAPSTDPIAKLQTEIAGLKISAENDFRAIQESAASALDVRTAQARLQDYEKRLDAVLAKAKQQADDIKAAALTFSPTTAAPNLGSAPQVPVLQLAPVRNDLEELAKIQVDANEAFTKAGEILQEIETPTQKYNAQVAILAQLQAQGRITTDQLTAAQQKLAEQLAESTDKLEQLLKKTGDASAGMQAFFLQLQKDAGRNGAFTFELLSKGLDGFENATVSALTGGKNEWRKYFEELDQMALKFALNKLIAGGLLGSKGFLSGIFGGGAAQQSGTNQGGALPSPLNLPKEAFGALPSFLSGSGGGTASLASAGASLTSAGTLLSSAAVTLQTAASTLAAGGSLTGGAGGAGTPGFNPFSFVPGLAGGGDLTPGASYLVGEQGPEPLSVDPSGRAFISPHSSLRDTSSSGNVHNHYYDLRGADPAVVQRLVAALPQVEERAVARAVSASSEISRRTANS